MKWLLLVLSLSTENATARMRAWRALKACGAAVLRDGVYLLPRREDLRSVLREVADDVETNGGSAHVLDTETPSEDVFPALFDRSADYGALLTDIGSVLAVLNADNALEALKQARKLRKAFGQLSSIDFFPGEAQKQAQASLSELESAAHRVLSPDEPHAVHSSIPRRVVGEHQQRLWATRARPWVDRLACAWLIRRFIDPQARILWLRSIMDCPPDALGFDFDGATFSHVGAKVSFETMMSSFNLEKPGLVRFGQLVHYLDVGGIQPPEASGVERVLAGLRTSLTDDEQLLTAACAVFDGLYAAFEKEIPT